MRKTHLGLGLSIGLLCVPYLAFAGSITGTFSPSASVANVCVIQSNDNLNFGPYVPSNAVALQTSGQIKLICTKGATATVIPISGGSKMTGGGGSLSYALYSDSGFSKVWGATSNPVNSSVNFANASGVTFNSSTTGLSQTQCASLASGTLYAYLPSWYYNSTGKTSQSACLTGYNPSGSNMATPVTGSYNSGLVVNGQTIVAAYNSPAGGNIGPMITFYAPSGALVSGYTYTVPTSGSVQATLSQLSTSVNTPIALTYYGRVPANQDIPPGTYTDTVTVQVSF